MKLKIKVTKGIIRKAMWCGTKMGPEPISKNCAIALAVRDIFPHAAVAKGIIETGIKNITIYCDNNASFIDKFDSLAYSPELRLELPEIEFEIDLPQEIIDAINIDDIHKSATLELI